MTIAERLITRLREAGLDLPEGSQLVRVYPSRAMRNDGAWTWSAVGPDGREQACRRCDGTTATSCRICRKPYCQTCLTDHHHEGHGTPAEDR